MGGKSRESSNTESHVDISQMGPQEQALVNRFQSLGMNQADAVQTVLDQIHGNLSTPQSGMVALGGQDKALLDSAYSGAETNLRRFGNLMGQDLAGTRGLNPSDTPVSEAVLRETLPVMANLQSARAQQELGLGLGLKQFQEGVRQFNLQGLLQGAMTQPAVGLNLMNRMQNERFARGVQYGASKGSKTASIGDSILQGTQAFNQFGQGVNQFAQGGSKMAGWFS